MFCYSEQITPEEYLALRKTAGWMEFPLDEAAACVNNAYLMFCVRDEDKVIAAARLLWDGGYVAFLSDLVVDPAYQGQGIGRKLMENVIQRIKADMKPGYKVKLTLNSSKDKEAFYEKFGFRERPNEDAGAAMDQWLNVEI